MINTILYGYDNIFADGTLTVDYSSIENEDNIYGQVYMGDNNIFGDPLLLDDFSLDTFSPCIDAGDPESALDPDNTVSDIGAFYYNQGCDEGYISIDVECSLLGDINQDGYIDIVDVLTVIQITLGIYDYSESEFALSDFNSDDSIDIADIGSMINYILES